MVPKKDYEDAINLLNENKFNYKEIKYNPLDIPEFRQNHKDRCYYCKKNLMGKIKKEAIKNGFETVLDGKNIDDLRVYRPGNKAAEEIGIISPLAELRISKKDIRKIAKEIGMKNFDKPSNSCLATRFPYNTELTIEKLEKVDSSEEIIKSLGIKKVRVRIHENIARIEVEKGDFKTILESKEKIEEIKNLGFDFITLDLEGYRCGSFD